MFCRATVGLLVIISLIMTLNCFINYHTTPIGAESDRQYTISELAELRDFIVEKCNELAEEIERDENGMAVYKLLDQVLNIDTMPLTAFGKIDKKELTKMAVSEMLLLQKK